jgi:hypothetical protein
MQLQCISNDIFTNPQRHGSAYNFGVRSGPWQPRDRCSHFRERSASNPRRQYPPAAAAGAFIRWDGSSEHERDRRHAVYAWQFARHGQPAGRKGRRIRARGNCRQHGNRDVDLSAGTNAAGWFGGRANERRHQPRFNRSVLRQRPFELDRCGPGCGLRPRGRRGARRRGSCPLR